MDNVGLGILGSLVYLGLTFGNIFSYLFFFRFCFCNGDIQLCFSKNCYLRLFDHECCSFISFPNVSAISNLSFLKIFCWILLSFYLYLLSSLGRYFWLRKLKIYLVDYFTFSTSFRSNDGLLSNCFAHI